MSTRKFRRAETDSAMDEQLVLVDGNDRAIGVAEKISVHRNGDLHRAFSIFVFDSDGNLLLQQRAPNKYHSGNLWSNTCCGHPRPGESALEAAHRRLGEEMGFDCELDEALSVIYNIRIDETFFEHEFDHVFIGRFNGTPIPNAEEVCDWKWISLNELSEDIQTTPVRYTYWLKILFEELSQKVLLNTKAT